jgi:hypothetical protein
MQYPALNRWEKNLAILSHCCFVWQYCNMDGGLIILKRRALAIRPRRASTSTAFHVVPESGIRQGKPVAISER